MAAARCFFNKAIESNGDPDKVAMDKSGANKAATDTINAGGDVPIQVRQVKHLNNIVEQDHCAIKRVTRRMLTSIIPHRCLRTRRHRVDPYDPQEQVQIDGADAMSFADQFFMLTEIVRPD